MADPLDVTNRSACRAKLKELLDTLKGAGKPLTEVFPSQPTEKELDSRSPVLWIASGQTDRHSRTISQSKMTEFTFLVQSAVRLDDGANDANWVEDRLDVIEKSIADLLLHEDNRDTEHWDELEMKASQPGYTTIGGNEYRVELTPVKVTVYDD